LAMPSTSSHQTNTKTTSLLQAMMYSDRKVRRGAIGKSWHIPAGYYGWHNTPPNGAPSPRNVPPRLALGLLHTARFSLALLLL
jgi:hypothetical protein